MIFPEGIKVYGDKEFRNKNTPKEDAELITFINQIKKRFPDTYGRTILHIKNEGKRTVEQVSRDKAKGSLNAGASDIIIPGNPTFVCELKCKDHTKSKIEDEQPSYMLACQNSGAFVCIALGWAAAWEALEEWDAKSNRDKI